MRTNEQNTIDNLYRAVQELKSENLKFREDINKQVEGFDKKIDQKHMPLSLEDEVVKAVHTSITKSFNDALGGYSSPLQKYALNVVAKYQNSIESVFDEVVAESIKTDEFKKRVREVLLHKIAKTMIAGIDGSVDKTVNQMKQDAVFRSRLTLSVNGLVNEFLNQQK